MVGMGDISGARATYSNLFLSSDPAIIPGALPVIGVGDSKPLVWVPVTAHGVFDAKASVYSAPMSETSKPVSKPVALDLGTVAETLPAIEKSQLVRVSAEMDVPSSGIYTIHAGFGESSHNVVLLDGKEVYRKDIGGSPVITKVTLKTGKRYPLDITFFKSGSAAFWLEQVDIKGKGDLVTLTKEDKKFSYLLDDAGKWIARRDVTYTDPRLFPDRASSPLSATSNNTKSIGPELGFGFVMGDFHDEPVLLIKSAMGNRSLKFDFRPPSSGRNDSKNKFEGFEYRSMIEGVHKTLNQIDQIVPGYKGQGYEIAGFAWFQGHKDSGATKEEYEKDLVNLIKDVRKEFNVPKMPVVVATAGFHGYRINEGSWKGIWEAQMAVGDPKQHPEFADNVASVDTRDFWREVEESPRSQDYHYNRNPETYLLIGEAMGHAMVHMQGGEAVARPKTDREAKSAERASEEARIAALPAPSKEQKTASLAAMRPMILDGALHAYLIDPRNTSALEEAVKGEKPMKLSTTLGDSMDKVGDFYRAANIHDYDWKPTKDILADDDWDYFSFDIPKLDAKTKGIGDLATIYPAGMETWFAAEFDAKKAGWKNGKAPFGVEKDTNTYPSWFGSSRRGAPKTVVENDVLLMRRSFEVPSLKDGHRYRIRVGGSVHANSGEGFAVYINGKLLAENKTGITAWRREGSKPRGSNIWSDFSDEFKNGKVTIAVSNFPMDNRLGESFIPARAPLSVWLEEMVMPEVGLKTQAD